MIDMGGATPDELQLYSNAAMAFAAILVTLILAMAINLAILVRETRTFRLLADALDNANKRG